MYLVNKDSLIVSNEVPNDYIAVFHGGVGELTYSTYIYKIDNNQANYGFKYINTTNTTKHWGSSEWNVKVTQVEQPRMLKTIRDAFEASWWAEGYETFVTGEDDDKLKRALGEEVDNGIDFSMLKLIRPFDYQQEILERLQVEREVRGHWKNLVVAATGTGKTVMAASDYKSFAEKNERARLLFIAHREEILRQSLQTFRQVLCNYNFGEKWYGGEEPSNYEYVFASKDTLNNRLANLQLPDDYYDYIVIDEVHHVAASSYRNIINYFKGFFYIVYGDDFIFVIIVFY
jgi:hypothetical protein